MKRWLLSGALALVLFAAVRDQVVLEDDPMRSLVHTNPQVAQLFERYHEWSFFRGKVFLDTSKLDEPEAAGLAELLRETGYTPISLFQRPSPEQVFQLASQLPPERITELTSEEALSARAQEALAMALLPGGGAALSEIERDPLGLGPAVFRELTAALGVGSKADDGGAALRVFRSPTPLRYDDVGRLYDRLVALGDKVRFIGGDFYSYENYLAVQRDIVFCSVLTLILNLLLFWFFTRRWMPLVLLGVGSVISYEAGLAALGLAYDKVFTLVLAFTSTFVGFNNEYLVHLAGIDQGHKRKSLLAVWSAIGTTFLGFIVLLLGRSIIVRQMALASLGGMAGFLVFLLIFRTDLAAVRIRTYRWPKLKISRRTLAVLAGSAGLLLLLAMTRTTVQTRIEVFRFESPVLERQSRDFGALLGGLNLDRVFAVKSDAEPLETLARLRTAGVLAGQGHPLQAHRSAEEQGTTLAALSATYSASVDRLGALLREAGLELRLARQLPGDLQPLSPWQFLDLLGTIAPIKWAAEVGGERYLFVPVRPDAAPEKSGLVPMSPQHYFDELLSGLSRELGGLFALGVVAMVAFLALLLRSPAKLAYALTPLALSAAAILAITALRGGGLNIIHFVGFALVIALATDYGSVAISTDHHELEMAKILLTSLSTMATFGVLLFARHPVLKDLGMTVSVGCLISSLIALFVAPRLSGEGQP